MLSSIPGIENLPTAVRWLIAAAIIFVLLALFALILRRLTGGRLTLASDRGRARQPRLGIVDVYDLDRQRQLILLRRDNVEHLLLVGGPNDVVVETNIVRGTARAGGGAEMGADRIDAPAIEAVAALRPVVDGIPQHRATGTDGGRLDPSSASIADAVRPAAPVIASRSDGAPKPATFPVLRGREAAAKPVSAPAPLPARAPAPPPRTVAPAPREEESRRSVGPEMARQLGDLLRRPSETPAAEPARAEPRRIPAPPVQDIVQRAPARTTRPAPSSLPPPRPSPEPRADAREPAARQTSEDPAPSADPKPAASLPRDMGWSGPTPVAPPHAEAAPPEPPRTPEPTPEPPRNPEPLRATDPILEPLRPAEPLRAADAPSGPAEPSRPDPFSIEDIEAEFARLLGRPLDRKDKG